MKKPVTTKAPAEQVVKDMRRATRELHSSEEEIRIVLSGLRGEDSIAELSARKASAEGLFTVGRRNFLKPARSGWLVILLVRPTPAIKGLRAEALALKELVADLSLENRLLKNMTGAGEPTNEVSCSREA